MATVVESFPSSDDVLRQMRCFLKGSLIRNRPATDDIIRSAIFLLQSVPAARQAVLEYLCVVFDEATSHVRKNEQKTDSEVTQKIAAYESIVLEVQTVLHGFIKKLPETWAPIISTWSIDLLGQISVKYSDRRNTPNASNLNEHVQQWMSCHPTKVLVEIASECFSSMVGRSPEVCVDALLEASVKYSPHFDWVVAHIGSCFPRTVINRVLMSGLEDFSSHSHGQLLHPTELEVKVTKMASVVGILSHLAGHHSREIHEALMSLFKDSLGSIEPDSTIPFLLQVASLSPVLLRALTINLVNTLTQEVLGQLVRKFQNRPIKDSRGLVNLVVHILTNSSDSPYKLVQFLLSIAAPMSETNQSDNSVPMETDDQIGQVIKEACTLVMSGLLVDLHRSVYHTDMTTTIPFLQALSQHGVILGRELAVTRGKRALWLSRLLTLLSVHTSEDEGANVLSVLLMSAANTQQLSILVAMAKEISIKYPDVLATTLTKVLEQLKSKCQVDKGRVITNLHTLTRQVGENPESFVGFPLMKILENHLLTISSELVSYDPSHAYQSTVLDLLHALKLSNVISVTMAATLSTDLLSCLFGSFLIEDPLEKSQLCQSCSLCLQQLCRSSITAHHSILRSLLEGVISKDLRDLFSGLSPPATVSASSSLSLRATFQRPRGTPLKDSIQAASRGAIFHAGIIGQGLRPSVTNNILTQEQKDVNCQLFKDVLWCVFHMDPRARSPSPTPDLSPVVMTPDFSRDLALLVIELVAPDVMYNGILWPEEDAIKVTVERDLLIKKKFEENPILWDIMDLLSQGLGALSYCSVLLRALTAVLLTFWESSRLRIATDAPWQLQASIKVIDLLRKGGLLASPLSHIGEVLPYLTPYEVHLLLLSVWKFMKENPPDPRCPRRDGCLPQYLDTLRYVLQSNVSRLGHLYPRFFISKHPT